MPVIDFLFAIIELFASSYGWERKSDEVCVFRSGWWVNLSANFRWKWTSPANGCWCQKTKETVVSWDIKVSVVCSFFLLQSTRMTDGQTELRLPIPRYCIAESRNIYSPDRIRPITTVYSNYSWYRPTGCSTAVLSTAISCRNRMRRCWNRCWTTHFRHREH